MQNKVLLGKFYQIKKIDQTEYSPHVFERLEKIRLYNKLSAERCSKDTALLEQPSISGKENTRCLDL
jgi:hypothetical protein